MNLLMKLMCITADVNIARVAQSSGVDWIFVDLEILGKQERQGHLDTVISRHNINDVRAIRSVLTTSKLLVRVNPINEDSASEINQVIEAGADIIMLPFFSMVSEVSKFLSLVDGRAETCLLVETPAAAERLSDIVQLPGIDYVHVGLNDLHLGYGMCFMFEPLANGMVDQLASILRQNDIEFGFGGIARLGQGALPAEKILGEHHRLGSTMVILSRSFFNATSSINNSDLENHFLKEVERVRDYELILNSHSDDFFVENRRQTISAVNSIVQRLQGYE